MPKPGTQARHMLDILLNTDDVSMAPLVRRHGFTQAGARIFELETGRHWPIEHSEKNG